MTKYKELSEKIDAIADYLGIDLVKGSYRVKERKQDIGFKERES